MDENDLFTNMVSAFEPYIRPQDEIALIRRTLSGFMQSQVENIEKDSSFHINNNIPAAVTGIRRSYLEALMANVRARRRHANLLDQEKSQEKVAEQQPDNSLLSARLRSLHQCKQYSDIQTLAKCVEQSQEMLTADSTYCHSPTDNPAVNWRLSDSQQELKASTQDLEERIVKLEHALIEAKHKQMYGKGRLSRATETLNPSKAGDRSAHFRALTLTRECLTSWLEESLTKCSPELGTGEMANIDVPNENSSALTLIDLQDEYDRYLQARGQYLTTATNMAGLVMMREVDVQQQSITDIKPEGSRELVVEDTLSIYQAAEHGQQEHNDAQLYSFAGSELDKEQEGVVERIQRLVDESQLLVSYPILLKSERFANITPAFGSQKSDETADEVSERIAAWMFASDAGGEATKATINNSVHVGRSAIAGMNENIEDLAFLKEIAKDTERYGSLDN